MRKVIFSVQRRCDHHVGKTAYKKVRLFKLIIERLLVMLKKPQTKKSLEQLILENKEDLMKDKDELDKIERRIEEKYINN